MIELINPLSTTLILVISVTVNGSNATTVSEEDYCYDQVGDELLLWIHWGMHKGMEKRWYGRKSLLQRKFGIETINNFVNGVKR